MGSLRLFLALSVALGHFGLPLGVPTSDIAVQSFFVISGFYMALVLNEKYRPGSYGLFISNRLLRLWPTYAVVTVLSLMVADNWRAIAALDLAGTVFFIASQVMIVGQEAYFYLFIRDGAFTVTLHPAGMQGLLYTYAPIPQSWTLALEIYFYLLAPFVVRRGPAMIAAIIAASLAVRIALLAAFGFGGEPWTYRFFPSEIALFMTGSLGYYAYAAPDAASRRRIQCALVVVEILLVTVLAASQWNGMWRLASLSLLAAVIIGVPRLFASTRNLAWDRYLGELSYPLYICHYLFGWILLPDSLPLILLALLMSLVASMLLYRYLEWPIDQWRQSRFEKARREIGATRLAGAIS
jgi:peptidoglycan/LPS O-acetylase OafA/YrhL